MKRIPATWLVVACVAAAAIGWLLQTGRLRLADGEITELRTALESKEYDLLGYTRYTTYLAEGKKALSGRVDLVTARVTRQQSVLQFLERPFFGLSSNGAVEVKYDVEYSFGYDLRPGSYDVRSSGSGIEVLVGPPRLLTAPAVTNVHHRVLSGGVLTDEDAAVIRIQEEASRRARQQGEAMASDPAIAALCEKHLTAFLHDFLAKQPGVKLVPQITIVYKSAPYAAVRASLAWQDGP
jgi:hypothetical protein